MRLLQSVLAVGLIAIGYKANADTWGRFKTDWRAEMCQMSLMDKWDCSAIPTNFALLNKCRKSEPVSEAASGGKAGDTKVLQ